MLEVSALRAFSDNYIWLIHSPKDRRIIVAVDPGDAAPVFDAINQHGYTLAAILTTHHHADHVGGVPTLLERYSVPVYGPARERIPAPFTPLREGDAIAVADTGLRFSVLDVPGHTAGHIAYVGHGVLFCGDTLFSAGCGRLFEGTAAQMHASLAKMAALKGDTAVYCAHEYTLANLHFALAVEPTNQAVEEYFSTCREKRARNEPTLPSNIEVERNVNPFLRCEIDSVKRAAEAQAGRTLDSAVDVFAIVRSWKDGFRVVS